MMLQKICQGTEYRITESCLTTWKIRQYFPLLLFEDLRSRRLFCHKALIVQFVKNTYGHYGWVGSCGWCEHNTLVTLAWRSSINFTQKPFWSQSITNVIRAHCLGIGEGTVFVPLIFYQVSHLTNYSPDINVCSKLYILKHFVDVYKYTSPVLVYGWSSTLNY
jgi:hypothetical protein